MDENYVASRYKSLDFFFSIFKLGFKFQKWFPYYFKNQPFFNLTNYLITLYFREWEQWSKSKQFRRQSLKSKQ